MKVKLFAFGDLVSPIKEFPDDIGNQIFLWLQTNNKNYWSETSEFKDKYLQPKRCIFQFTGEYHIEPTGELYKEYAFIGFD